MKLLIFKNALFSPTNKIFRVIVSIAIIMTFLLPIKSLAAGDKNDSLTAVDKKRSNRAALMSALVPGLGQISNKKYWKLPLIYGGSALIYYFIKTNNVEYKKFKTALIYRNDNDSLTNDQYPNYTEEDLRVRKDYYRRNRDLSYIFAGILYTLNIIDAYVDAQLLYFDVSDNLSIYTGTVLNYSSYGTPVPSVNLVFTFK